MLSTFREPPPDIRPQFCLAHLAHHGNLGRSSASVEHDVEGEKKAEVLKSCGGQGGMKHTAAAMMNRA